nr:hypothetical protein ZK6.1 - Caenorhabditis elegans [Caenorhabditis elegans]
MYRLSTLPEFQVPSCNACKIFFRRLITRTMPIKKCFLGEYCFEREWLLMRYCRITVCRVKFLLWITVTGSSGSPYTRKCAACRFQKCLRVGMRLPSFLHLGEQNKENHKHWAFHCCLVTVDHMKKFPFVNLLRYDDQKYILKKYFIRLKAIIGAHRSMMSGRDRLIFPDGSDVLAQAYSEWDLTTIPSHLIHKIRCRLVGRIIELKITNEEHLLLCVLLFCNPASQQLSQNGKILLTSYQSLYSSALLQYCLITYQKAGPSRFTELLGIFGTIEAHYNDVVSYHVLVQLNQSKVETMQLVKDGIEGVYKM